MNIFSAFLEEMDCFPNISYISCCDWQGPGRYVGYYSLEVTHGKTTVGKQPADSAFACRIWLLKATWFLLGPKLLLLSQHYHSG